MIFLKGEVLIMSKVLVAYFSASGVTAKLAKRLAEVIGADLHEIQPEVPYTDADLDWMNKKSRSSVEMNNKSFRPAVANKVENMEQYSVIFTAFPIWWYVAPTIAAEFCKQFCDIFIIFDTLGNFVLISFRDRIQLGLPIVIRRKVQALVPFAIGTSAVGFAAFDGSGYQGSPHDVGWVWHHVKELLTAGFESVSGY